MEDRHAAPDRGHRARSTRLGASGGLFVTGLACALVATGAASAAGTQEAAERAVQDLETWVRLKGDAGGELTYEWVLGTAHALPEGAMAIPLFRIESVTLRRFRRLGPAHYEERSHSCRLYRALEGETYLKSFRNPLTGAEVALEPRCGPGPTIAYSPERVELQGALRLRSSALGGPLQLERSDAGELVVFTRHAHSEFLPEGAAPRHESSIDTYTVPRASLSVPLPSRLPGAYQWTSVGPWMRGLGLDDRPGRMLWVVHGRNVARVEDLPPAFRAELARVAPGALEQRLDQASGPSPGSDRGVQGAGSRPGGGASSPAASTGRIAN